MVMITNMTRKDNGLAGIQSIISVQAVNPHKRIPILLYVFDKELAFKKLKDHQDKIRHLESIKVGSILNEAKMFI